MPDFLDRRVPSKVVISYILYPIPARLLYPYPYPYNIGYIPARHQMFDCASRRRAGTRPAARRLLRRGRRAPWSMRSRSWRSPQQSKVQRRYLPAGVREPARAPFHDRSSRSAELESRNCATMGMTGSASMSFRCGCFRLLILRRTAPCHAHRRAQQGLAGPNGASGATFSTAIGFA